MKLNKTLLGIFIAYIAAHIVIFYALSGVPEHQLTGLGQALRLAFFVGSLWIITLILVTVLAIVNRKKWFHSKMTASSIVLLICCTILPFIAILLYVKTLL